MNPKYPYSVYINKNYSFSSSDRQTFVLAGGDHHTINRPVYRLSFSLVPLLFISKWGENNLSLVKSAVCTLAKSGLVLLAIVDAIVRVAIGVLGKVIPGNKINSSLFFQDAGDGLVLIASLTKLVTLPARPQPPPANPPALPQDEPLLHTAERARVF